MTNSRKNIALPNGEFPDRLRQLREDRRLSKADLAEHSGLTYRTIHDLEHGRRDRVQERTLLALAEALGVSQNDLLGTTPSEANGEAVPTPARTRRPLISRRTSLIVLAVLLVVLVGVAGNLRNFAIQHSHWELEQHRLTLRDAVFHTQVWMLESECRLSFCEISPWNDAHLLVGIGSQTPDGGRLLCLERSTGDTLWSVTPDIDELVAAFGADDIHAANFNCGHLEKMDWDGDGTIEVAAQFTHGLYYPTVLCAVGPDGQRLAQYAHKGHLYGTKIVDLDGDGRDELLTVGTNNAKAYQGATVLLLDREHWSGASLDAQCDPESQVPDSARVRTVLPQYPAQYMAQLGLTRLSASNPQIHHGQEGTALISIGVGADAAAHILVYLDAELRPLGCEPTDAFAQQLLNEWPAELTENTGPTDAVWRAEWLARHKRFEAGHWPPRRPETEPVPTQ